MVKVGFNYGNEKILVELPEDNLTLVKNRSFSGLRDLEKEVSSALDAPIGTEQLEKSLSPQDKVTIIVDDVTRDTPVRSIFPLVFRRVKSLGVKSENVTVVMATGTHKRQTVGDLLRRIGGKPDEEINLHVHSALDKASLTLLGVTSLGTPVWINSEVADADYKIGIGGVRPHPEAGYGGGGKIILPGVSAWESVGKNHLLYLFPRSRMGVIENNPFRSDIDECAEKAGLNFVVNVVLNGEGEVAGVFAGDPLKVHREGVELAKKICENRIEGKADMLIMGFGPKDDTVWQILGIAYTLSVIDQTVKEGGSVILVGSCREGIYVPFKGIHHLNYKGELTGTQKYVELLKTSPSTEELLSIAIRGEAPYPELGAKGVLMSRLWDSRRLIIASNNLNQKEVSWFGERIWGVDKAINEVLKKHGKDAKIVAIPEIFSPKSSMKPFPIPKNF